MVRLHLNKIVFYIIIEYIFKILSNYSIYTYYKNFFLKLQDIWGFITIYYDIYELFDNNIKSLNNNQKNFHTFIKNILIKFYIHPFFNNNDIYLLLKDLLFLNKSETSILVFYRV